MLHIFLVNTLFLLLFLSINVTAQDETTEIPQGDQSDKEGSVKRFILEDEYYPPIVGSYKYNAVIEQFELPESVHSTTVVAKSKDNLSTGLFLRTGHHLPDRKSKVAYTKEPVTVAPANSKKPSTHNK